MDVDNKIIARRLVIFFSEDVGNADLMPLEFVKTSGTPLVPDYLKNYPPHGSTPHQYPHSFPHHFVRQKYNEGNLPQFYRPTELGREKNIKERLRELWGK